MNLNSVHPVTSGGRRERVDRTVLRDDLRKAIVLALPRDRAPYTKVVVFMVVWKHADDKNEISFKDDFDEMAKIMHGHFGFELIEIFLDKSQVLASIKRQLVD